MSITFFGEITELDSRAIWYSDEEDSDEDGISGQDTLNQTDHESIRESMSNIKLNPHVGSHNLEDSQSCIVSLASKAQCKVLALKNQAANIQTDLGSVGNLFIMKVNENQSTNQNCLWVVIDDSHQYVSSHLIAYFVEHLLQIILNLFKPTETKPIIILSKEFSSSDQLDYLGNNVNQNIPFVGRKMMPPCSIKNSFESSIFEQLTLSFKPALLARLPNPNTCWFNAEEKWSNIPNAIIRHRLEDYSLDKTLIFT